MNKHEEQMWSDRWTRMCERVYRLERSIELLESTIKADKGVAGETRVTVGNGPDAGKEILSAKVKSLLLGKTYSPELEACMHDLAKRIVGYVLSSALADCDHFPGETERAALVRRVTVLIREAQI